MLPHPLCDAIEAAPYSNDNANMTIAHVATTSWCCHIGIVATHVMRCNRGCTLQQPNLGRGNCTCCHHFLVLRHNPCCHTRYAWQYIVMQHTFVVASVPFAMTWTSCHCKVQQRLRRCISCCCHTYNRSKSLCCNAQVLQIQNAFCNAKQKKCCPKLYPRKRLQCLPTKKSVAISDIAAISGLLQHFLGVQTGSKFNIGSICRGGSITSCSY